MMSTGGEAGRGFDDQKLPALLEVSMLLLVLEYVLTYFTHTSTALYCLQ